MKKPIAVLVMFVAVVLLASDSGANPTLAALAVAQGQPVDEPRSGGEAPLPVVTRPSATEIVVAGANYVRINSANSGVIEPTVIDGHAIDLSGIYVPTRAGRPVRFLVEPDQDYSIHAGVRFSPGDDFPDATAYSTHEVPATRMDKIQALIYHIAETKSRKTELGEIGFMEIVDALDRIEASARPILPSDDE